MVDMPLMYRLVISVDRCRRIFVYNLIASHLRKPSLRNFDFKLVQPVNSELFIIYVPPFHKPQ